MYRIQIKNVFLLSAVGLMLSSCAPPDDNSSQNELTISPAWIRLAPPGVNHLAGYGIIRNSGQQPVSVVAVKSAFFSDAGLHETVDINGQARMRAIKTLTIPAKSSVELKPGGRHLMLMGPTTAPLENQVINVQLLLQNGTTVDASFTVLKQ